MLADRQIDKHTYTLIAILRARTCRGEVTRQRSKHAEAAELMPMTYVPETGTKCWYQKTGILELGTSFWYQLQDFWYQQQK